MIKIKNFINKNFFTIITVFIQVFGMIPTRRRTTEGRTKFGVSLLGWFYCMFLRVVYLLAILNSMKSWIKADDSYDVTKAFFMILTYFGIVHAVFMAPVYYKPFINLLNHLQKFSMRAKESRIEFVNRNLTVFIEVVIYNVYGNISTGSLQHLSGFMMVIWMSFQSLLFHASCCLLTHQIPRPVQINSQQNMHHLVRTVKQVSSLE